MLKDARCLILTASPMEPSELRSVFSDQPTSIRRKLECPPTRLRSSGWDLPSMTQAEFVRGELIRVFEPERMVVDLYRDGTLILGGRVDRNFLAWSDKEDIRLHALALIELTLNFTRFYGLVLEDSRTPPNRVEFGIQLKNMHLANQRTKLLSGPVQQFAWDFFGTSREAPADCWERKFKMESASYDPEQVAFSMIRELYLWFGHSDEAIPYTKANADPKAFDAGQIAAI